MVAAAGTVMDDGTVTKALLEARFTIRPPFGADPDKVTVQVSASAPVMEVVLHASALTVGDATVPVPLRLIAVVGALL